MATPILAALLTPDQSRPGVRRLLAAAGLVAFLLALGVRGDPLTLLLTCLAGVLFTALAFHADDAPELRRFAVVNGVAMLLLVWGASERADLIVERDAGQLTVSIGSVRLGASLAPGSLSRTGQDQVAIAIGGIDARPVVAAWVFDHLPSGSGFGYWLAGGMRPVSVRCALSMPRARIWSRRCHSPSNRTTRLIRPSSPRFRTAGRPTETQTAR